MGSRYPILNASFAPVFNTPAISQVLQNGSFQAPFPSFSYEDLGLTLKAKPSVYTELGCRPCTSRWTSALWRGKA